MMLNMETIVRLDSSSEDSIVVHEFVSTEKLHIKFFIVKN